MSRAYDTHTLFIKCDCATESQIRQAFQTALSDYQSKYNVELNCKYRVNLVETREGISLGIAFVFVTNSSVYFMLLGKNPDGSDRVTYIDDPSWIPPPQGELSNSSGWSNIDSSTSWADISICDNHDVYQTCPKIISQLPPLMELPPYTLTPAQIEAKRLKIIHDNEGKAGFDEKLIEIPTTAHLCVDRAMVTPVEPKFMPHILKSKGVPQWITPQDLKSHFAPYASDNTTIQDRFIKGLRIEEAYPFVNINPEGVAFIIFDPRTHDAQFALHMMRKVTLSKTDADGHLLTVTLLFGHSFRTDRDLMVDINQRGRVVRDESHSRRGNFSTQGKRSQTFRAHRPGARQSEGSSSSTQRSERPSKARADGPTKPRTSYISKNRFRDLDTSVPAGSLELNNSESKI